MHAKLQGDIPLRYLTLFGYGFSIFLANWAIITFGLVPVGFGLMAPAGVYAAGLTLGLRDAVQEQFGKTVALIGIFLGVGLSALVSPQFALASGLAFLVSELCDFAVYTPIRQHSRVLAVVVSNTIGVVIDSALFLFLAFGSLDFLLGQVVGKTWITVATAVGLSIYLRIRMSSRMA